MSHFSVMVVGDNISEQMDKYQENNMGTCPKEYLEFYDDTERFLSIYNTEIEASFNPDNTQRVSLGNIKRINKGKHVNLYTFYYGKEGDIIQFYRHVGRKCFKSVYCKVVKLKKLNKRKSFLRVEPLSKSEQPTYQKVSTKYTKDEFAELIGFGKKEERYGYFENPNAKWDWYVLGGRFKGMLSDKEGNTSDTMLKKDIDFEKIYEKKVAKFNEYWKKALLEENPVIKSISYGVQEGMTKEDYINKYCDSVKGLKLIMTYAVLKDSKWMSNGDMGWFGISTNEIENWEEVFEKFWNEIDDNSRISIIDCHI